MSKKRIMKEFHLAEISLVDSPAQEPARVAILKRDADVSKRLAITTMTAGHAHSITTTDPYGGERRMGQTSYVDGHVHDFIVDEAGSFFVADAQGHNHGIAVLTKRKFSAEERETLAGSGAAMPDGSFPIEDAEDLANAIQAFGRAKNKEAVARHIRRRAKALGLTDKLPEEGALASLGKTCENTGTSDGPAVVVVNNTAGEPTNKTATGGNEPMTPEQIAALQKTANESAAKIAELEKANARSASILKLSREQRSHFDTLSVTEQDSFLSMSNETRDQLLVNKRDADPVVYTRTDGTQLRKSAGELNISLARENDATKAEMAKQQALAKRADLEKRAGDEFKTLGGDVSTKAALLGAVEDIKDEGTRGKVMACLKAHDAGLGAAFQRLGTTLSPNVEKRAADKLEDLAKAYALANKVDLSKAYDAVLKTAEGVALYQANRSEMAAGR